MTTNDSMDKSLAAFAETITEAVKTIPLISPKAKAAINYIIADLHDKNKQHNAHIAKVRKEIANGCRQTEGDII